jgi:rfaE bifunctional protein nucleotidyltransferase chain/domain
MRSATARILGLAAAVAWRSALRRDGARLALTNGCFDLLHAGHVEALERARGEGEALVVLLNSDASVRALKGPERPIYHEEHRAYLLAALRCVDAVIIFEGEDCAREMLSLSPEVYVKSEEYRNRQNPAERAALAACGSQVVWLPRRAGLSTSAVVARMGGSGGQPPDPRREAEQAPRTPQGMGTAAGLPEYRHACAAAPVADAGTHVEAGP